MSTIRAAFDQAAAQDRAALVGYLTAFDPSHEQSRDRILAACEAGLDVLELGVPFSDPTADGPDVQGAMVRALAAGATLRKVLSLAAEIRARVATPIVLFSYANPLLAMGPDKLAEAAHDAGIGGLLVVDLPPGHAGLLRGPGSAVGLDWVGLVAPTTSPARMSEVAAVTSGFVYTVTLKGVTGAALDVENPALQTQLEEVRAAFDVPMAAGFGIRGPSQVEALAARVDGVVVGSALIAAAKKGIPELRELVGALAKATRRGSESGAGS